MTWLPEPTVQTAPLLAVDDLQVSFATPQGELRAVQGVSLTLERGKTLGIVGESGSGKTVLSRAIMGLLPRQGGHPDGIGPLPGPGDPQRARTRSCAASGAPRSPWSSRTR